MSLTRSYSHPSKSFQFLASFSLSKHIIITYLLLLKHRRSHKGQVLVKREAAGKQMNGAAVAEPKISPLKSADELMPEEAVKGEKELEPEEAKATKDGIKEAVVAEEPKPVSIADQEKNE